MQNQLQHTAKMFNVSLHDTKIIADVIEHYNDRPYSHLKRILLTLFKEDIKPEHYIVLGNLIGLLFRTDEPEQKINHLQICLRQN